MFTPDVVYDVTDVGMRSLRGIAEILRATLDLGERNPLAHHVTNITITDVEDDCARTRSKAIVVIPGGGCGSATYIDSLRRDGDRWLISHRTVLACRTPLNGAHTTNPSSG